MSSAAATGTVLCAGLTGRQVSTHVACATVVVRLGPGGHLSRPPGAQVWRPELLDSKRVPSGSLRDRFARRSTHKPARRVGNASCPLAPDTHSSD